MTHEEIRQRELVEAYIRRQLAQPERIAVEDHLIECDECFVEAQSLRLFLEGVREAAESGRLQAIAPEWFGRAIAASPGRGVCRHGPCWSARRRDSRT